jgi:hypothetical protein
LVLIGNEGITDGDYGVIWGLFQKVGKEKEMNGEGRNHSHICSEKPSFKGNELAGFKPLKPWIRNLEAAVTMDEKSTASIAALQDEGRSDSTEPVGHT